MRNPVPIYRAHDARFQADTCRPLLEAARRQDVKLQALVHGHYPGRALRSEELSGVKSVGYWDARRDQTWGLSWHRNEGIEITYLESGKLAFAADDNAYTLQADALTITRPWQNHRVGNPSVGPGKLHWLILDVGVRRPSQGWKWPDWIMLTETDRNRLEEFLRQTDQPVWRASVDMQHCFQAIASAVDANEAGSQVSALTIRINELLLLLLELFRRQNPRLNQALTTSSRTVELFLHDLKQHPDHLTLQWSVEEMASSCGLAETQFYHIVKQVTNMTPWQYLNNCRLELAARLLCADAQASVAEIAQSCGFSSSQYFATVFARKYSCSPSVFRKPPAA